MKMESSLADQVEVIARTVASEGHAALLWRDKNWDWYLTLREATLRLLRRDEALELRHLQFVWFVQKYCPLTTSCVSEMDRFLSDTVTAELRELVAGLPTWTIDDCVLFSCTNQVRA